MIERLIRWGVPRYLGGPGRSWVFTSIALMGYRMARGRTGRRQLVDLGSVDSGQKIVIEHVSESHATQIKGEKRARKAARSEQRAAKKVVKVERRNARQARRAVRVERRRTRRATRAARRPARSGNGAPAGSGDDS